VKAPTGVGRAAAMSAPFAAEVQSLQASTAPLRILLTDAEMASAIGVSSRKFHELCGEPWAPKCIVLGARLHRHSLAEWHAAVASMPRQEVAAEEPLSLAKARAARATRTEVR